MLVLFNYCLIVAISRVADFVSPGGDGPSLVPLEFVINMFSLLIIRCSVLLLLGAWVMMFNVV